MTWGFTTGSYQVPDEETIQTLLTKVDYTQIQYDEASGKCHNFGRYDH